MVLVKQFGTFFEGWELVAVHEGDASAETFGAGAVAHGQRDGADAVAKQFVQQLFAGEAGIGECEVESVGERFVFVVVIYDFEAVVGEYFLHNLGFFAVFLHIVHVVVGAVVAGLEDGGHGVLGGVGGAGADGIDGAVDDGAAEYRGPEIGGEVGELAVEQFVGDAEHADSFAGVAEGLGAGNQQRVVVGVFAHAGLIRRLTGGGNVTAEVHAEVGEILNDYHVVFRGQLANDLQLLVGEADP